MRECPDCNGDGYHRNIRGESEWNSVCDTCGGDGEVPMLCDTCERPFEPIDNFHTTCWGCLVDELNPQPKHTQKG